MHLVVLIPILNDWVSVAEVITGLDQAFATSPDSLSVLMVDDGSTIPPPARLGPYKKLAAVSVLKLKKNVGHQRALAVGLCHIAEKIKCDAVVIMDGDGQDVPADAARLVERMKQLPEPSAVFAERVRRSESLAFRFCYGVYKLLHLILTGLGIHVGNFSVLPAVYLDRLAIEPMLWNHYAASVMRARVPVDRVPTARGSRIQGESRLNFVALVVHGLSALACYGEIIGVRLILLSGFLFAFGLINLAVLIGLKLFTNIPVYGWTSTLVVLTLVVILQVATLVSNFTMQIISLRSMQPFLPARDYAWFVAGLSTLYPPTA
ncbi:MAG TPA: glycosyltransferase [Candidatus Methylacidiphilales bacterium]|nr:glycosyltransferase [Candidatus Methylacidiphilales bacterium]